MGILSHIISCLCISLVAMVLCTIRDGRMSAALDREALTMVEKWLQEGPPSTTMGKGRLYLSSLWWIGPGLVGTTPDPLKECGADLHSLEVDRLSWYEYLSKSEWQRARERLDCLREKMAIAEEEHEAFSFRVKVMGVTFMAILLLKWTVSLLMDLDIIPETLILEDPIPPSQEEDQNTPSDDPETPTEEEDQNTTPTEEEDESTPFDDPVSSSQEDPVSSSHSQEEDQNTPSEDPVSPSQEDPVSSSQEEDQNTQSEDPVSAPQEEERKTPSEDSLPSSQEEENNNTQMEMEGKEQEESSQGTDDVTATTINTTLFSDSDWNTVELSEQNCQCNGIHLTFYLSDEVKFTFHFKTVPPGFTHSDIARIHKTVSQEVDASAPCEELLTHIAEIIKRFLQ